MQAKVDRALTRKHQADVQARQLKDANEANLQGMQAKREQL